MIPRAASPADDLPVTTIVTNQPIRAALIHQVEAGGDDLVAAGSRGRGAVRPVA